MYIGRIAKLVVEPDVEKNPFIGDTRRASILDLRIVKEALGCLFIISIINS